MVSEDGGRGGGEDEVIVAQKYTLSSLLQLTISEQKTHKSAYLKVRLIFIYIDPFMQLEFWDTDKCFYLKVR